MPGVPHVPPHMIPHFAHLLRVYPTEGTLQLVGFSLEWFWVGVAAVTLSTLLTHDVPVVRVNVSSHCG